MIFLDARRWLAVAVLGCTGISCAWADGLPDCPTEPFSDVSAAQRAALLSGQCSSENSNWKLDTPRAKPADAGPSLVKAQFNTGVSRQFSSLQGMLKFNWAGLRNEWVGGGLRTEQAALAAGGLIRLGDMWAVQMNLGRELTGAARSRATMASIWQPTSRGLLFAEWAGSDTGTEARRVGGRWWLVPGKLVMDVGARYMPEGVGWIDQRVGLTLDLSRWGLR